MHSALLPSMQPNCLRHHRGAPAPACSWAPCPQRSCRLPARQRLRTVRVQAARSFYDLLGVTSDASDRDIKKAYRQKALKLHPDVNKAPDAERQFLEVKNAFQVLSDPQQRSQYDRKLRGGFGGWGSSSSSAGYGDFGSWGSSSSSSGGGGGRARPKQQEEEFYGLGDLFSDLGSSVGGWVEQGAAELSNLQQGAQVLWQQAEQKIKDGKLEDFFKDLDKELEQWSKKRASSGKPASLWEELAAIGEEFVDFLEQGLKEGDGQSAAAGGGAGAGAATAGKEGSSTRGSSSFNSSTRPKNPVDAYEELKRQYDLGGNNGSSSSSSGSSRASTCSTSSSSSNSSSRSSSSAPPPPPPPPPPKKSADEEIDEMLAALKKKMNKP